MFQNTYPKRAGFTLVEIMIVVAIIALLAAIAVPNFLRARKRSQATRILQDLRIIDQAVDQYAIENNKSSGNVYANWTDVQTYLKKGTVLYSSTGKDLLGNSFGGGDPTLPGGGNAGVFYIDGNVMMSKNTYDKLSDVAPLDFWSPFYPAAAF